MFKIHNQTFKTKKALSDAIREIVDRYQDNEPLNDNDFNFMLDVLSYHPQSEEKRSGIERIWVAAHPTYPNRCFWLSRADGSSEDFSWKHCLTPPTRRQDFDWACRREITPQVIAHRDIYFMEHGEPAPCAVSGKMVTRYESDVDHEVPFKFLVDAFLDEFGIDIEAAPINMGNDQVERPFTDPEFARKWSEFHRERAKLRVVTKYVNRSVLRTNNYGMAV